MSLKKVWKTGHSHVIALNAHEVNHLELFQGNNVTIITSTKRRLIIERFPKVKPRKHK